MHDVSIVSEKIFTALQLVNEDKYDEALEIIQSIIGNPELLEKVTPVHWQNIGDIYLMVCDFTNAKEAYIKANNNIGIAFTLVFTKQLNEAKKVIKSLPDSPPKKWCNFLIGLFDGATWIQWPTFLEIRNFMELTIYLLLKTENQTYLNQILKNLKRLLDINLDSEKLIGYAFFHSGKSEEATTFLFNSLQRNSYDGEAYLVLGKLFMQKGLMRDAMAMLENAKMLIPEHEPTIELLEKVKSMI